METILKKKLACLFVLIRILTSIFSIDVAGSSTVRPIIVNAKELFTSQTGIKVTVSGGGSSYGAKSVISKLIDIGLSSRDLKQSELDAGLEATIIGYDGLAIIVNSGNPIDNLNREDVVGIFTGKTESWQELTGSDEEIIVTIKEEGRGARDLFDKFYGIKENSFGDYELGSNPVSIAFTAGDPHSICYVSIGTAEAAIADGVPIKILSLDGVEANSKNLRLGTYSLKRPLSLITIGAPKGEALSFTNFMLSSSAQVFVGSQGFISIK